MTEYAANTSYQIHYHEGYPFLITRTDFSTERFPNQYVYDVYEPLVSENNHRRRHSTMYRALGSWWGEVHSFFDEDYFERLPYGSDARYKNVKIYHFFRDAIKTYLIQQAIHFEHRWLPLPFID